MKTRIVESAFGVHFIKNNWDDIDWDKYQFNLKLRQSIYDKVIMNHRNLDRDEKAFINELEIENQNIREKYGGGV